MRLEDSIYNIRRISTVGIPEGLLEFGCVTILDDEQELGDQASKVFQDILNGIDIRKTSLRYDFKISNDYPEVAEFLDCNIILSFPTLSSTDGGVLIATAKPEELGHAVAALMRESERRIRNSFESSIALFALGAKSEFLSAVDILLYRQSLKSNSSQISFTGRTSNILPKGKLTGGTSSKVSDWEIRAVYESLPDRYSDLYEKRNPISAGIIRYSLEIIDQKNLVDLLFETAKTDRNLFKKLENARQKIASKFRIKVRKWSSDQKKFFKDQYKYCIYVSDMRGNETPIKFRNNPSYCLFMMHVLDRQNRGEHSTALVFKDNEEEFKKLYHSILDETPDHVKTFCKEMIRREDPESGVLRKGRYDDYIKDINDTLDELMGSPDSLALKIGHGQFLQIPQNNIEIDPDLPKFNFV